MFYVGKFDESGFAVPHGYAGNSQRYERASLIDPGVGSVHMGAGVCQLLPQGSVACRVHANEKGIYVIEGELEIKRGPDGFRLSADDYALIPYGTPHALRNTGVKAARWFEMQAPQPKPPGGWQDTFFTGDNDWPAQPPRPHCRGILLRAQRRGIHGHRRRALSSAPRRRRVDRRRREPCVLPYG